MTDLQTLTVTIPSHITKIALCGGPYSQVPPLLSETLAVWRMVRLYQNQKPS